MTRYYWKFCAVVAVCMLWVIVIGFIATIAIIVWKVNIYLSLIAAAFLFETISRKAIAFTRLIWPREPNPDEVKNFLNR